MGPSESWEIGGKGLGGGGQEMMRGGICALFFPCCAVVQRATAVLCRITLAYCISGIRGSVKLH